MGNKNNFLSAVKTFTGLFFLFFAACASAAPSYEFISRNTAGTFTAYGKSAHVTPDGRFVVYLSSEMGLVSPNSNQWHIYLFDRALKTTELISTSSAEDPGNAGSFEATISDDGCRVLFKSAATNLVPGAGGLNDIFLRNRCSVPKQTTLVSAAADGTPGMLTWVPGDAASEEARISGDGRYAVFVTYANNISGEPTQCGICNEVVRKNLDTGAVDRVSGVYAPNPSLGRGRHPDISRDGSRVVFYSSENGLGIGSKSTWDHYLWDAAQPSTLTRVSTGSSGETQINSPPTVYDTQIHQPAISGDGRYVAFTTTSGTLAATGGNGFSQVYVKDTLSGTLTLASVSPGGALGDNDSNRLDRPALSYDGRYVAFYSYANNLVTSSAFIKPLVHDLQLNQTLLVADQSVDASSLLGLSADVAGRFVVFSSNQTTLDPNFPNTQGLYLADLSPPCCLSNISTRGPVQTGANVMIGGFIISGTTPKTVLIRARGPSLTAFGVPGAMANPTVSLYSGQTMINSNDNWTTAPNAAAIMASGYAPTNPLESAILVTLSPGPYTAIVSGVGLTTGVGIVEVLEIDNPASPLSNISTRGLVQTVNNVLIGGFIISGTVPKTVLIRARGPSLTAYGVPGALQDPMMDLYSASTVIDSNDDWAASPNVVAITATGMQPTDSRESAILTTLSPGAYTVIVRGFNNTTGVGIVEVLAQ